MVLHIQCKIPTGLAIRFHLARPFAASEPPLSRSSWSRDGRRTACHQFHIAPPPQLRSYKGKMDCCHCCYAVHYFAHKQR